MTILHNIAKKALHEDEKPKVYMVDFKKFENTEIDEKLISVLGWNTLSFEESWGKVLGSDIKEYEDEYKDMIKCRGIIAGDSEKTRFLVFDEPYEPSAYKTRHRFHLVEVSFEKALEVGLWAQEKNDTVEKEKEEEILHDANCVMKKLEKELGFTPSEKMVKAIAFTLKWERNYD